MVFARSWRQQRAAILATLFVAAASLGEVAEGGIVGQWDFSNGWNPNTGSIPAVTAIPGLSLTYLPKTPLYQNPLAQSAANPPPLEFATTGSFGIANLGTDGTTVVMKVPDMRGYGLVTGLMATFPQLANGPAGATKLNRYSILMDVYIPGATDAQMPPYYLTLLQTRLGVDGAWLVDKRNDTTGVASGYGGSVGPNAWHRLAVVLDLSNSGSQQQYRTAVNGTTAATIVPDQVPLTSERNAELVSRDLFTDGDFSIGTLNDSVPGFGPASAFFLFNADRNDAVDGPTRGELGTLYVANLQFRDDALSAAAVASLGGPAPGIIPVPEPATLSLLAAAGSTLAAAITRRRPRRTFLAEAAACGGAVVAGGPARAEPRAAPALPRPAAVPADRSPLVDYVFTPDGSRGCRRIAAGDLGAGRFVAAELVSQTWRGVPWRHQLAIYTPARLATERPPLLLWIDGGSGGTDPVRPPEKQLPMVAAVAEASGLPTAIVRQVPYQPMFDGRREDDLIAHTFEQFLRTGDPSWPLLLPMVKSVSEALTAAIELASTEWQISIDGGVLTGASKRGWTTWLTAAADTRVRGLMPMVIDMLDLPRHIDLQVRSFGAPSEAIHDYVSRGLHTRLDTPRGQKLMDLVDPVRYADAITQPKLIALGTNDPYWPLESLDLYLHRLRGPRWISYAVNTGHNLPVLRVAPLFASLGRHVAGVEPLPELTWPCGQSAPPLACSLSAEPEPAEVRLWSATSATRDFRTATWESQPVKIEGGRCSATVVRPDEGFAAGLLECRFAGKPLPIHLTTGVTVVAAS